MLINELKSLVQLGFLERHSYSEVPPRVEYTITYKGMDVFPLIDTIIEWSVNILVKSKRKGISPKGRH